MSNNAEHIKVFRAPEFDVKNWIDADGNKTDEIKLSDYKGKFKIVYCFQSWCPGCHSKGLPDLKKMVDALKDSDTIKFFAIQTVFEGFEDSEIAINNLGDTAFIATLSGPSVDDSNFRAVYAQ